MHYRSQGSGPLDQQSLLPEAGSGQDLIVIGSSVSISGQQLRSLKHRGAHIIALHPEQDELKQLSHIIRQHQQIQTLHLVTHGAAGHLFLGDRDINLETLDQHAHELSSWSDRLSHDADILLYGCNVGANVQGDGLLQSLANLTGADIAASDDLTGSAALGGDWQLETQVGHIEADPLKITGYTQTLAEVSTEQQVLRVNFDQIDPQQPSVALDTSPANINHAILRPDSPTELAQDPSGFQGGIVNLGDRDSGLIIKNSPDINAGVHAKRSIVLNFKVDDKNAGRQVLYEEGGGARGLNIYLDQGKLYVGGWNRNGGQWQGTYLSTNQVSSNQWHQVVLRLNAAPGEAQPQQNRFQAFLDGEQFATGTGSELLEHLNGIGLGNLRGNSRFHDGVQQGNLGMVGQIGDLQLFNRSLSTAEISTLAAGFGTTSQPQIEQLNDNPGFEGSINTDGSPTQWYSRLSGAASRSTTPGIGGDIRVIEDPSNAANHLLYLKLPETAQNNYQDQLNLQQYHQLDPDKIYQVEAKVKWLNSRQSPLNNAIVSFWTQTPDGVRFGNDFFLQKAQAGESDPFQTIRYEFSPTTQNFNPNGQLVIPPSETPGTNSVVWLGVYPHFAGAAQTELHVDDFTITEVGDVTPDRDLETDNKVKNGTFSASTPLADWSPISRNPGNLAFRRSENNGQLRLQLPSGSGNLRDARQQLLNESFIGVKQTVTLKQWVTYELSADITRVSADRIEDLSLLNIYAIRTNPDPSLPLGTPQERLGPIDYDFSCNRAEGCASGPQRVTYTFRPSESTDFDLTFRVFGFGNEGNGLTVDIDNIQLRQVRP